MDYENENRSGFMTKLAAFIVDKRNLVFLLIGICMVFSLFSRNWVAVENDLTAYLPADSATKAVIMLTSFSMSSALVSPSVVDT